MDDGQEEYIRRVLEAYRQTPGTAGTVRRPDRVLAGQLYQRGVSVTVIENAFVLAATRRQMRPADAAPLGAIRSLAYFLPVIEEWLGLRVSPDYFQYAAFTFGSENVTISPSNLASGHFASGEESCFLIC